MRLLTINSVTPTCTLHGTPQNGQSDLTCLPLTAKVISTLTRSSHSLWPIQLRLGAAALSESGKGWKVTVPRSPPPHRPRHSVVTLGNKGSHKVTSAHTHPEGKQPFWMIYAIFPDLPGPFKFCQLQQLPFYNHMQPLCEALYFMRYFTN